MAQMLQLGPLSLDKHVDRPPPRIKHQDKAAWIVGGRGFFDDKDQLWPTGSMLYFDGVPNVDLYPLNKLAHERKELWLDMIEELAEKKAKKEGKQFVKAARIPWREDGEAIDDVPTPNSVLGVRRDGQNEQIR